MLCPKCFSRTIVFQTRTRSDSIIRQRKCLNCSHVFKTIELDLDYYERITQRNGSKNN